MRRFMASSLWSFALFLFRPWRYYAVCARIGDRLAEVLVLIPEQESNALSLVMSIPNILTDAFRSLSESPSMVFCRVA